MLPTRTSAGKTKSAGKKPAKKATNLSLDATLLQEARDLGVNLSAELEEALADIVRRRRAEAWLQENRAAIDAYNAHVDSRGVFSDGIRTF